MQPRFDASYSVLKSWAEGRKDDALKMYFKFDTLVTPAMQAGIRFHSEWEKEIRTTNRLPVIFGARPLIKPMVEKMMVWDYPDRINGSWLRLKGKSDVTDEPAIIEFKSGLTESSEYANHHQVGIYGFLAIANGRRINKAEIYHYNQHDNKVDMSIVWLTNDRLRQAIDWAREVAWDMYSEMIGQKLFEKYGHRRTSGNTH